VQKHAESEAAGWENAKRGKEKKAVCWIRNAPKIWTRKRLKSQLVEEGSQSISTILKEQEKAETMLRISTLFGASYDQLAKG
jgi:hypothetical protein